MRAFIVEFTNREYYRFWAEDEEHAREQGIDAEPTLEVKRIEEIPSIHASLSITTEMEDINWRDLMWQIQDLLSNERYAIVQKEKIVAWVGFEQVMLNEKL